MWQINLYKDKPPQKKQKTDRWVFIPKYLFKWTSRLLDLAEDVEVKEEEEDEEEEEESEVVIE